MKNYEDLTMSNKESTYWDLLQDADFIIRQILKGASTKQIKTMAKMWHDDFKKEKKNLVIKVLSKDFQSLKNTG